MSDLDKVAKFLEEHPDYYPIFNEITGEIIGVASPVFQMDNDLAMTLKCVTEESFQALHNDLNNLGVKEFIKKYGLHNDDQIRFQR